MPSFTRAGIPEHYIGLSTDTKPAGVAIGSRCYETDTGAEFLTRDGTNWIQYAATSYFGNVLPIADNAYDLGSATLEWKDLYVDGTAYLDNVSLPDTAKLLSETTQYSYILHDAAAWEVYTKATGNSALSRLRIPSGTDVVTIALANSNLLFGHNMAIQTNAANGTILLVQAYENGAYVTVASLNSSATTANLTFSRSPIIVDNVALKLGTDSDSVFIHKSAAMVANEVVAGLTVGVPVTLATAANSLVVSNITSNGDIHFIFNVGGNSKTALQLDGSAHQALFPSAPFLIPVTPASGAGTTTASPSFTMQNQYRNGADVVTNWNYAIAHTWTSCVGGTAPISYVTHSINSVEILRLTNTNGTVSGTLTGSWTITGTILANSNFAFQNDAATFSSSNVDARYVVIQTRDSGVGLVEVVRIQGAADPYFQIGRDDTGVATNAVTDMLVLQAGAGTNNEAVGFGLGVSFKLGNAASQVEERASIDVVLVNAADGAEESKIDFNIMVAGAMIPKASLGTKGLTYLATVDSAAVANQVTIGGYDISAGHRALSLSCEEVVVVETDETKFSHKLPVRINGATYNLMLCAT